MQTLLHEQTIRAYKQAVLRMNQDRTDLIVLITYMAELRYEVGEIAYAVKNPFLYPDVLHKAKDEIARRESVANHCTVTKVMTDVPDSVLEEARLTAPTGMGAMTEVQAELIAINDQVYEGVK